MPESRHEPASDRPHLQHQPRARQAHALNRADAESELVAFSSFVVRDLQKFWAADFQKIYLDLGFFRELAQRFQRPATSPRPT